MPIGAVSPDHFNPLEEDLQIDNFISASEMSPLVADIPPEETIASLPFDEKSSLSSSRKNKSSLSSNDNKNDDGEITIKYEEVDDFLEIEEEMVEEEFDFLLPKEEENRDGNISADGVSVCLSI